MALPSVLGVACRPGVNASPVLMLLPRVSMASLYTTLMLAGKDQHLSVTLIYMKEGVTGSVVMKGKVLWHCVVNSRSGLTSARWIAGPLG